MILNNLLDNSNKPDYKPYFKIPNGRKEEYWQVLITTLSLTLGSFMIISGTLFRKSKQKIVKQIEQ